MIEITRDDAPSLSDPSDSLAATGTATEASTRSFAALLSTQIRRLIAIVTYPFVVIFTIISLVVVTIFCIFPTLLCMSLGVCIYYCVTDSPIPLSTLLRYVFAPDPEDASFPTYRNYSATRESVETKLIVRKVLKVETIGVAEEKKSGNSIDKDEKKKELPRRHPGPIDFRTSSKCIYFSEPILYEDSTDKKTSLHQDSNTGDQVSNSPLSHAEFSLGEDISIDAALSEALATVPDDIEIGLVDLAIDELDTSASVDELAIIEEATLQLGSLPTTTSTGDSSYPSDESMGKDLGEEDLNLAEDDVPSNSVADAYDLVSRKPQAEASCLVAKVTSHLEEAAEIVDDYFGISTDTRERGLTCDICLLDFEVGEEVTWSPNLACSHTYHKDCMLDWLIRKPSCPSCRQNYVEETPP